MPGSSLWLLPPSSHPLNLLLTSLISKTNARFNSPYTFLPHVTLTSDIPSSAYSSDPQAWLDELAKNFPPAADVSVQFEKLEVGSIFVKKITVRVRKDGVRGLAETARGVVEAGDGEAEKWAEEAYLPHLSLLYSAIEVSDDELREMERVVEDAGVDLEGKGEMGGWVGGRVVLVETDKKIEEWEPIAVKDF
ncbi:2, 3 cyclic phosphodiesterase [Mytilinidion resinicola]|uniref:2, 3 cyclic phosphodiesterase n=1 Tax=Mytilinidion resinicola TaxID=574789 RepID=A0A6A6Y7K0_9PEZI|nr:2, 3 cyclic phosphodiesterase [Mytilinidion resinicola]KAF2804792.1 2, 3 cyclic phosphodiesterase [Mytilinidion resinicola]